MDTPTMIWTGHSLKLLDQTCLPREVCYLECVDHRQVAAAIKTMQVRGAPAIGAAAAYGYLLGARELLAGGEARLEAGLEEVKALLAATRPTAVNLFWALERMHAAAVAAAAGGPEGILEVLAREAVGIAQEDAAMNRRLGDLGAALVPAGARILTHCNAGALATAGYGTALGVVRSAHREGKVAMVYVDETRPLLQGARLTAWELLNDGIPATLITDNMAGSLMARGRVDLVLVGADRIAANGDVANKIGTYSLAVLAAYHHLPFYVAAPWSTVDEGLATGEKIPIEERDPDEVRTLGGRLVAPADCPVYNPAFDVTPGELVTAIVTDRGIMRPPYAFGNKSLPDIEVFESGKPFQGRHGPSGPL